MRLSDRLLDDFDVWFKAYCVANGIRRIREGGQFAEKIYRHMLAAFIAGRKRQ